MLLLEGFMNASTTDEDLRERALKRLRKKREFSVHLLSYVVINAMIIVIWATVAGGGFFWPMFPILGWGIGIIFHAWDVYQSEPTEADITREMEHLRRTT
jgi:hypothetical protein